MPGTRLTRQQLAWRVAQALEDGWVVNLGIGMPTLVSNYIDPAKEVLIHSENGLLGIGPIVDDPAARDPDLINAGKEPVRLLPGAAIVHQADSFALVRGGHIHAAVLGGLQVAENGDLANWRIPTEPMGSIGGAMDIAVGAARLFVMMTHTTASGEPKLVRACSYPLTAERVVTTVFTDLAVVDVTPEGFVLREVAPGWTPEAVQALTGARLRWTDPVRTVPLPSPEVAA